MKTVIEAINTPSTFQFSGDTAELRLYATIPFVTSDGQLIGQGSAFLNQSWYLPVACEVQPENMLYVPSFEVDSTTDGQPRISKYIAALFDESGTYVGPMPTTNPSGFAIPPPSVIPNPTWGQLAIYNKLPTLLYPPTTYPTSALMYEAIAAAISQQLLKASATDVGNTALSVDPTDPTFPIALGVNDPNYLALLAGGGGGGGFVAENGFYNVTNPDYNLNLDGTTDDTVAFQALVDLVPNGSIIFFPCGTGIDMVLDGEVTITARHNLRFTSFNNLKFSDTPVPVLRRRGNAGGRMLNFLACYGCTVDGLRFTVDGLIDQFGAFDGNPQAGHISSQNNLMNCSFQFSNGTTNEEWVAWSFSQTSAQNNELMTIENCSVFGFGQATMFENGSISASDTTLTLAGASLTVADEGKKVRVGLAGANGYDLISTIASVTNSTTCEIADAATSTVSGTRCFVGQSYGTGFLVGNSQNALHYRFVNLNLVNLGIGVDIDEGSGRIELISGGQSDIDVRIRRSLAEGWIVQNLDTEATIQTLYMDGGDQLVPCHVYKVRGANDSQAADGWMYLSGVVYMDGTTFRVAPPRGGSLWREATANSLTMITQANLLVQSSTEHGSVDYYAAGFGKANSAWSSRADIGTNSFALIGPDIIKPYEAGPFITHSPATESTLLLPGMGSVISSLQAGKSLECNSQLDSLLYADGALEVAGSYRSQQPLTYRVGTHAGAATYRFCVVAVASDGSRSMRSYATFDTSVTNTLNGTNYLLFQWVADANAATYEAYLQNPANAAEGWQLATGIVNNYPAPSTYTLNSNPTTSFVAWSTLVPSYPEAEKILFKSRFAQTTEITFTDADTSPTVRGGNRFVEANTNPASITAFDNGIDGQAITIRFTTANTTIVQSGTMKLAGGVDFVGTAFDSITLERIGSGGGAFWLEKARSVNA